jgi:uncharacterized membrane protein HdeD (DUF308 family)
MSTSLLAPLESIAKKIGRFWWVLLIVGIAWIVVGFVVLRFDSSTVELVSVLFGILILLAAGGEIFRAVVTPTGWRVWHVIFAVLLVLGAVLVFVHPGDSFVSLALVTGFYFVFAGTYDIVSSLFSLAYFPGAALQLASGVLQVVLGFIASSSLSASIFVLVLFVALSALFRGVAEISAAFAVRAMTK